MFLHKFWGKIIDNILIQYVQYLKRKHFLRIKCFNLMCRFLLYWSLPLPCLRCTLLLCPHPRDNIHLSALPCSLGCLQMTYPSTVDPCWVVHTMRPLLRVSMFLRKPYWKNMVKLIPVITFCLKMSFQQVYEK